MAFTFVMVEDERGEPDAATNLKSTYLPGWGTQRHWTSIVRRTHKWPTTGGAAFDVVVWLLACAAGLGVWSASAGISQWSRLVRSILFG